MKFSLLSLLLATAAPTFGADFIRQIQIVNGQTVIYDLPIAGDTGEVMSKPIPSSSAVFQLYTQVTADNKTTLLKLDEKTVGTYLPTVTAQILSEDPAVPARTRADKPYGISLTISGLQTAGANVPAYASQVQVRRSYKLYDPATRAPSGAGGEYLDSFTFRQNGGFTDNAVLQRLPVEKPTKAMGEESFTVYTHPDASSVQGTLAKATVKIWPVAVAEITGIEDNKIYLGAPTTGSVKLTDLYPKSSTYVQVYKGAPTLGKVGTILPASALTYNSTEPQNAMLALSDLGKGVSDDGTYTVEVMTITPFNGGKAERLAYRTFQIDTTIQVNAGVTTME